MGMIRIIVVEDDARFTKVMRMALAREPDFEVTHAFCSAEEALGHSPWPDVDVLICDLGLPGMGGVEYIALAKERAPQLVALAYTLNEDRDMVFAALRAGASGYLLKGCSNLDLGVSIRNILEGECPMSPAIARRLLEYFLANAPLSETDPLTSRETEIVRMLADGLMYKEVAGRLGISWHTVHSHVKGIYVKLQAAGKKQAILRARSLGYLG